MVLSVIPRTKLRRLRKTTRIPTLLELVGTRSTTVGTLTKPTSIKFTKEELSDIDTECEGLGCTRTAFIKEAVKEKLEGKDRQDQDVPNEPKITVKDIPDEKSKLTEIIEPTVTEIKEPQKITVKEVPQDNSQKPTVTFTQFNGKLLPFAKRYNI